MSDPTVRERIKAVRERAEYRPRDLAMQVTDHRQCIMELCDFLISQLPTSEDGAGERRQQPLRRRCPDCRKTFDASAGAREDDSYPCADCGAPRTKAQGGTTFTVCDSCWDKRHPDVKRPAVPSPASAGAREDCDLCVKGICSKHQPTQEQFDAMQAGKWPAVPSPEVCECGLAVCECALARQALRTDPSVPPLPTRVEPEDIPNAIVADATRMWIARPEGQVTANVLREIIAMAASRLGIAQLRADLAAAREENERLRAAWKLDDQCARDWIEKLKAQVAELAASRHADAGALEGVITETISGANVWLYVRGATYDNLPKGSRVTVRPLREEPK